MTSSRKGSEVEARVGGDEEARVGGDEEAEGGHSLRLVVGSSRTQHSSSLEVGLAGRGRLGLEKQEGSVMTSSLVKRIWWR